MTKCQKLPTNTLSKVELQNIRVFDNTNTYSSYTNWKIVAKVTYKQCSMNDYSQFEYGSTRTHTGLGGIETIYRGNMSQYSKYIFYSV